MFTPHLFKIKLHTRRVLICRRTLPVFAFLLASLMLVWPTFLTDRKDQFSLASHSSKPLSSARVDMERVRFFSQDKKRQPLTVTAPRVLETDVKRHLITLYKPIATYKMESGVLITAKTPYGVANQDAETLTFEDEVTATTDTGYQAVSTQVLCDNKAGVISGAMPLTVTGPAGTLKSVGFKLYNKGDNIDFLGHTDTAIKSDDGDIRILSEDGLFIEQPLQTITAIKSVRVTQQDKTITADKMILTYWTKSQNPTSRIKEIVAIGNVVAFSPNHKVTGGYGIYDPQKGTITMRENVVLHQGNSFITGETGTINLNTGENTLTPKKNAQGKPNRVRGRLIPTELKGSKK